MSAFEESNSDFYDLEYFISMEYRYLSGAHRSRYTNILKSIGQVRGLRVLDLGCGGGFFADFMAQQGADVLGMDYAEAGIRFGKDRYPELDLRVGSAYDLPDLVGEECFDVVALLDVIEHMSDHDRLMGNIRTVLKPGGKLVISTDNDDSPWLKQPYVRFYEGLHRFSEDGRAYRLIKRVEARRKAYRSYHDSHINEVGAEELRNLLARHDFSVNVHHVYPLVGVPARDVFLRLLPLPYRGDHQCIVAQKG